MYTLSSTTPLGYMLIEALLRRKGFIGAFWAVYAWWLVKNEI